MDQREPATARVALLTPAGRGGIALLEIAGGGHILARVFSRPLPARGALALGRLADASGPIDEVLVARTGEDRFEIGCHGGPAVARRAVAALTALGATESEPAAEPGSRIQVEARALLPLAETELAAKVLLAGLSGELDEKLARLSLDESSLAAIVASARLGMACVKPPSVALLGRPNAGKSTLFNALLGRERAIVSPVPGTTRDALEETCSLGGVPVRILDLAGIRESADEVEQAGVARGLERARAADLSLAVVDASAAWEKPEGRLLPGRAIIVLAKRDLLSAEGRAHLRHRIARDLPEGVSVVEVSARTGTGLEGLRAAIVRELVGLAPVDVVAQPVLFTERQLGHATRALEALRGGSVEHARQELADMRGEPWPDGS
jgi:tRNA modification GTPase